MHFRYRVFFTSSKKPLRNFAIFGAITMRQYTWSGTRWSFSSFQDGGLNFGVLVSTGEVVRLFYIMSCDVFYALKGSRSRFKLHFE
jgi:hypothetical protein